MDTRRIKAKVLEKYGEVARQIRNPGKASCCAPGDREQASCSAISGDLYRPADVAGLPEDAVRASLGCGNPVALAELRPGEVVLDLGSGGGIDVLLSARRVAPSGKVYGLDASDDMLALSKENQRKASIGNVEFLKGDIEHITLPDHSVDVVISNCVINLSADKDRVLREAFRVLKPGGRFAVSDIVVRGSVPAQVRRSVGLWIGCLSGALEEAEYRDKLAKAGFEEIDIEPTRIYRVEDARAFLSDAGLDADVIASQVDGAFMSAFVRATKPATAKRKVPPFVRGSIKTHTHAPSSQTPP